jgi:WD40 repeat protein
MNHILKNDKYNYTPSDIKKTKITCIVANDNLIYIGDDNGVIKIFSLNTEIEIGPLNYKPEELVNMENKEGENNSVTSMDILASKNLLACGYFNGIVEIWDLKNKKCKKK